MNKYRKFTEEERKIMRVKDRENKEDKLNHERTLIKL